MVLVDLTSSKLLSFELPNFKVISHWAEQIRYLGPPWLQLTRLWEQKHQECKLVMCKMNMKHLDKSVLIHVCTIRFHLRMDLQFIIYLCLPLFCRSMCETQCTAIRSMRRVRP